MRMISENVLFLRGQRCSAVKGKREIGVVELPYPRGAEGVTAEREGAGCVGFGEEFDVYGVQQSKETNSGNQEGGVAKCWEYEPGIAEEGDDEGFCDAFREGSVLIRRKIQDE